jgi:predicted nucleic acid-binding protein
VSLDPPTVLLDRTFLAALIDADDVNHVRARDAYLRLVDDYEANRVLLAATSDDLRHVPEASRHGLLAPVFTLHIAAQHRRAAARVAEGLPDDLAVPVVLVARERIRRIATFDARWSAFDIEIVSTELVPADDDDPLSSRTGPGPARPPTA